MLSVVYNEILARGCEIKEKNDQELPCTLRSCSYTSESAKNRPRRTPNSNKILPGECIFCLKNSKYKNRTQEKLRLCCEFRSVVAIRTAAEPKNNFRILGLLSEDPIAREGKYYQSCYVHFTRCRQKPTNYLSVFDHFVGLALKGLKRKRGTSIF